MHGFDTVCMIVYILDRCFETRVLFFVGGYKLIKVLQYCKSTHNSAEGVKTKGDLRDVPPLEQISCLEDLFLWYSVCFDSGLESENNLPLVVDLAKCVQL